MQIIWYNSTRQPMVKHGDEKPVSKKHLDKNGKLKTWEPVTKMVDIEI